VHAPSHPPKNVLAEISKLSTHPIVAGLDETMTSLDESLNHLGLRQ